DTELKVLEERFGVLQNDRDLTELPLTAQLEAGPTHGTLSFFADGTFRYQPLANFAGTDGFSYSVSNGSYRSSPVAVEIVVTPVNDAPVAVGEQYTLDGNNAIVVPVENGLLANDFDEEGESLTAIIRTPPSHGQITINRDGSFYYVADDSFHLTDKFTYAARDSGGISNPATVVLNRNAPTITAPTSTLLANTANQQIQIMVAGGQPLSGLDLFLQLGDGGVELTSLGLPAGTSGPRITHVDLKTDTVFSSLVDTAIDLGSLPQLVNWSISNTQDVPIRAEGTLATITVDTTGFFGGEWGLSLTGLLPNHPLGPFDTTFAGQPAFVVDGLIRVIPTEVEGRYVFYNDSSWDGRNAAADARDDLAIATDKQPLLPGETATFGNYTSYVHGLNGVMFDIAGLETVESLQPSDLRFRVGRTNDLTSWQDAPLPELSVRKGAGVDGSDRVTLTWPNGSIQQQWLEVTLPKGAATGLASDDRFYFGNIIG
ncbi:MAG: tandem-95 repeat protein, partial [Planctomycetales bacterium]|nr:tandem-95 repeat protein [Planctomycetales bacterium]